MTDDEFVGIQLPGPPTLPVIPGAAVYDAPRVPENVFFEAHQYWLFAGSGSRSRAPQASPARRI